MPSNKLLPIIAGLVLLMLVFVGVKSIDSGGDDTLLDKVPVAGTPDADSPADTIRTLTAQVASIKNESEKLQMQNQELLRQRQEIESKVRAELLTEMRNMKNKEDTTAVGKLTERLDFFKNQLDELTHAQNGASQQSPGSDIPVGFGIGSGDGITLPNAKEIVWIEPLGTSKDRQGNSVYPSLAKSGDDTVAASGGLLGTKTENYLNAKLETITEPDEPVYTVPRNATLIGSTGMTALIGRIPFKGVVEDPFPFKVIVGRDNLAANGIEVPGLDGMVFSGKATGDWTLSCVRGDIVSVTYVFADGTIRELSADTTKNLLASQQGQQQGGQPQKMGWISDRRGIPCVTGTRISNAPDYLAGRILASAAEAAAGAFSQAQTTNAVSLGQGVATSVITGDAGQFAAGQALAGGANEVSQYLRERAAQSFDAVYVDTGAELAVHVDIELPIDYEPDGRKTHYASTQTTDDELLD
ncbi:MAG: TIGR03752 family integrating conjugative element protein [Gammaproteobacteria bacterium]|nr:TIGR03752 family integrating conjugative element protein [Gammaproteobacteria bacterium]